MASRDVFFPIIRQKVFGGSMSQPQVDGANAILDAWQKWAPGSDPRFIAYSLATAYWETDRTLQPIAEIGHGHGHSYGAPTGPYHQAYYGRGFVQLTWLQNYEKADAKLKSLGVLTASESLVRNPDLAMRDDIAAPIMIKGMLEGWFTGRKLSDFFHGSVSDWVNARTIINGHDHAAEIGHYAIEFFEALEAQRKVLVNASSPSVNALPNLVNVPAAGPARFAIGDSIAEGTAIALGWPRHTQVGLAVWAIAQWPVPSGLDVLLISMGTNPGLKNSVQMSSVRNYLKTMAEKAEASGVKRIVWIQPAKSPRVPQEGEIVAAFAKERGESCIRFVPGGDGIHPANYTSLAHDVLAALDNKVS